MDIFSACSFRKPKSPLSGHLFTQQMWWNICYVVRMDRSVHLVFASALETPTGE